MYFGPLPEIIIGLQGPLNHQIDPKKLFRVQYLTSMIFMGPLDTLYGPPV